MSENDRRKRGLEKFEEVYCGDLPVPEEGQMPFFDLMLEQLFGEVWTRPELSQRDRRLLTMGVIAAQGNADLYAIQTRSALKNGELTPAQARESVVHLVQYAGYPRGAGLVLAVEQAIQDAAGES